VNFEKIREAANAIIAATGRHRHDVATVLGSGLSGYAESLPGAVSVEYRAIPHFPTPKVDGHTGSLFSVQSGNGHALLLAGRVHAYEGWDMADVVFGVRTAAMLGCRTVILTNAAGGLAAGMAAGDLVVIRDHLNLTGRNPLVGDNDDRLGPRFPNLSPAYDEDVRAAIAEAARASGLPYSEGIYAWFLGPSYETAAEVHMAQRLGADLVGMSTVPEAIALTHMGVRVGGISLVTNLGAGIGDSAPSHQEVNDIASRSRDKFTTLLDRLLPTLVDET
jgi:purine-nucleoside phosphorylase